MKPFNGFPARARYTSIPNLFFSGLLPQINDIAELKVTLHIFWLLYPKKGYPRFISYNELAADKNLIAGPGGEDETPAEALSKGLELAADRGTIIHLTVDREGVPEDVYFLNTEADRRAVEKIKNGELALAGLKAAGISGRDTDPVETPNIYTLYEENIGMLTPMIAEELKEAEDRYPAVWIDDAFREAVSLQKRSWRYIARILENWSAEGKDNGTYRRDIKKGSDKYSGQKYGNIIRR